MNATITAAEPKIEFVDANTVRFEANVRTDAEPDADFIESIRKNGVIMPVRGRKDADGQLWVRMGQMRTLAAQATGQKLPIVYFEGEADTEEPAWLRLVEQLAENDHRTDLTDAHRVAAWKQMEIDGLSMSKIAGATGEPKERIKAGLTVAKSSIAGLLAETHEVDLLQLAAMTEFEGEDDVLDDLLDSAAHSPRMFEQSIVQARISRDRAAKVAARVAELEAEGKTTATSDALNNGELTRLSRLEKDDTITVDPELGDGIVIVVGTDYQGNVTEVEAVTDPAAFGYKFLNEYDNRSASGPMTDEQKAARKLLIRSNKAWDATEAIRADWLESFLKRKQFPKDASTVVAVALTRHANEVNSHSDSLTHQLLGIEQKYGSGVNALADLVEGNPGKAGLVALALVLGKLESGTSRNTWRYPSAVSRFYLTTLRSWDYELSPVELIAIGEATALPESSVDALETEIADEEDFTDE